MAEYIERDAALDCFACDLAKKDRKVSYQGFCIEAAFRIVDIPAADVAPVVHGAAVKVFSDPFTGRMFTTCSEYDGKIGPKDKYCKHCGAKMDAAKLLEGKQNV